MGVCVNTATCAELELLRGIDPSLANEILEEREQNGSFRDAEDLSSRVRHLGLKAIQKLMAEGLHF